MSSSPQKETKFIVRYDPHVAPETGSSQSYKLLEISPELARVLEAAEKDGKEGVTLTMKGTPGDDAVICTASQTFSLRTITISNSMLFLRPTPTTTVSDSSQQQQQQQQNLLIQDTAHEILELTPTVPRLDRLETLLKHTSWPGMRMFGGGDDGLRGVKRSFVDQQAGMDGTRSALKKQKRYTRAQLQSLVQASDVELDVGLKDRNVIQVDGHLLYLPTRHLLPLLSTLLSLLTIHAINPTTLPHAITHHHDHHDHHDHQHHSSPTDDRYADPSAIAADLESDFSVDPHVSRGVMGVFGDLVVVVGDAAAADDDDDGAGREVWRAHLPRLVKEIGRGLLSLESTLDPPSVNEFMARWKEQVGPAYEILLTLESLEGEYLLKQPPSSAAHHLRSSPLVVPFSVSTLPLDPAQRFSDLFATRAQWRPEDMQPFLRGLTPEGDRKALDKLVVKYVRVVKDSGKAGKGSLVWWHARR